MTLIKKSVEISEVGALRRSSKKATDSDAVETISRKRISRDDVHVIS